MDDADECPRRKKSKSGQPSNAVVIGVLVGVLLLVSLAGGVAYYAVSRTRTPLLDSMASRTEPNAKADPTPPRSESPLNAVFAGSTTPSAPLPVRPPLPPGWVEFRHPSGEYSVYLPSRPTLAHKSSQTALPHVAAGAMYIAESYASIPSADRATFCGINSGPAPPNGLQSFSTNSTPQGSMNLFPGVSWTSQQITWAGLPACEMVTEFDPGAATSAMPGGAQLQSHQQQSGMGTSFPKKSQHYIRYIVVRGKLYVFEIHNALGSPTEAERSAFFDSVVFGK